MTYPSDHGHFARGEGVRHDIAAVNALTTTVTATDSLQIPPVPGRLTLVVKSSANAGTSTIKVAPYTEQAQSSVGSAYKFLASGAVTATTNVAVAAATVTSQEIYTVLPHGDSLGVGPSVHAPWGLRVNVTQTGTATVNIHAVFAEES